MRGVVLAFILIGLTIKGAEPRLLNAEETRLLLRELSNVQGSALEKTVAPSSWKPGGPYYDYFYLGQTNVSLADLPGSYRDAAGAFQIIYQGFTRPIVYKHMTADPLPKPENMAWAGAALHALRKYPDVYEHAASTNKGEAQQIYFRDLPEGMENPFVNAFSFKLNGTEFKLSSTRSNLLVQFYCSNDAVEFSFHQGEHFGRFSLRNGLKPEFRNHAGENLVLSKVTVEGRKVTKGSIEIPYSGINNQSRWITGVEHGQYIMESGGEQQQLYFASEEEPVRLWLEHELGGGLLKWRNKIRETGSDKVTRAHLQLAATLWLKYLEGL